MTTIADNPPLGLTLYGHRIPNGWRQERHGPCGFAYHAASGLSVIETVGDPQEYGEWLHISASRPERVPSWTDMTMIKRILLGGDTQAIMVIPTEREYVNIHPNVLHLWHRLDGETAPHFALEIAPGKFSI
jgi:hypothetical protein